MKTKVLFIILMAALAISACGGKAPAPVAQPVEQAPAAPVEEAPAQEAPAAAAEQPAAPQPEPQNQGGMMAYTAPEGIFTLDVPASWGLDKDKDMIEETVFETFTSPDGNAFVQVLVNDVGQGLDHVLKGEVTVDYMRRLYGSDLRIGKDVLMKDGREKLEWWSDQNQTSGTTYFDQVPGFLYFYTVGYKDDFENKYKKILGEVDASFVTND